MQETFWAAFVTLLSDVCFIGSNPLEDCAYRYLSKTEQPSTLELWRMTVHSSCRCCASPRVTISGYEYRF